MYTLPLAADRSNSALSTIKDFGLASVEGAAGGILHRIALGAVQREGIRPTGILIPLMIVDTATTDATASPATDYSSGYVRD